MFTQKTIKEDYFNPAFKAGYQYIENNIREILQNEGLTEENEHDLWKCLLDMAENDIPYRAFGKLDAHIMYFFTDIRFIVFQKSILKKVVKKLMN